uniref:Uncharacterized protein n=1 Tax=Glossina pallidipes TaxID=7398 RepID=A0A1A9ZN37_GLOPL
MTVCNKKSKRKLRKINQFPGLILTTLIYKAKGQGQTADNLAKLFSEAMVFVEKENKAPNQEAVKSIIRCHLSNIIGKRIDSNDLEELWSSSGPKQEACSFIFQFLRLFMLIFYRLKMIVV